MEKSNITNHAQLLFRIQELKSEKMTQEIELKRSVKEFVYTFSPIEVIKNSLNELTQSKEVRFDLAKVGLNVGANLIIDKVLGRGRSIKGFLGSMLVEKLSTTFINNNAGGIISTISKLIKSKSE